MGGVTGQTKFTVQIKGLSLKSNVTTSSQCNQTWLRRLLGRNGKISTGQHTSKNFLHFCSEHLTYIRIGLVTYNITTKCILGRKNKSKLDVKQGKRRLYRLLF